MRGIDEELYRYRHRDSNRQESDQLVDWMTIPSLITEICTAIVGSHFRLGVYEGSDTLLLEVFAPSSHIGWLIGHDGQTVKALQDIAIRAGYRDGIWVYLRVYDE